MVACGWKEESGVSDGRKREGEGRGGKGRTANEFCVVIEKHSGENKQQKCDEHEKNREFDPAQPNR